MVRSRSSGSASPLPSGEVGSPCDPGGGVHPVDRPYALTPTLSQSKSDISDFDNLKCPTRVTRVGWERERTGSVETSRLSTIGIQSWTHYPSAVEFKHVARRFVTPDGKILSALEEFDLSIAPGEFVAIVGPTGCGKSTTLGLITGLAKPQAGEVTLFDAPVNGIDRRVGFVFQQDAVFPWRSVIDNVMAGPLFRGVPKAKADDTARDWLARVGLTGFEEHYPHQLSGGMRKRVALAQTFINEPQVLLMDEPFSALDVQTRELMQEELLHLWSRGEIVGGLRHPRSRRGDRAGRPGRRADHAARRGSSRCTPSICRARASSPNALRRKIHRDRAQDLDDLREEVLRARAGH